MIEINLLPEELQTKKTGPVPKLRMDPTSLLYLIPVAFTVLIAVHIYLAAASVIAGWQLGILNKKWQAIEPQRKVVDAAGREYAGLTQEATFLQRMLKERVVWAEKLNLLSLNLTPGIWFNEIRLAGKDFSLKGSVFSLTRQEIGQINKFLDGLVSDVNFFKDFSSLQLGPVQKASIGSYEVAEFILSGKLK